MTKRTTRTSTEERLNEVRRIIRESGVPYAQIARDSGVSYATIHAWITGLKNPKQETLDKVAAGFRARAAELERSAADLSSLDD